MGLYSFSRPETNRHAFQMGYSAQRWLCGEAPGVGRLPCHCGKYPATQHNGRVCLGSQLHGTEGTEGQSCGEGRVGQSHRHRGTQEAEAERSPLTDFLLSPDHSICASGQRDETAKGLFSWIILIGIPRLFG